jgi:hypothetical protein
VFVVVLAEAYVITPCEKAPRYHKLRLRSVSRSGRREGLRTLEVEVGAEAEPLHFVVVELAVRRVTAEPLQAEEQGGVGEA